MMALGFAGIGGHVLGGLVGVTGIVLLLTALFGWCPMCAMVGRKL